MPFSDFNTPRMAYHHDFCYPGQTAPLVTKYNHIENAGCLCRSRSLPDPFYPTGLVWVYLGDWILDCEPYYQSVVAFRQQSCPGKQLPRAVLRSPFELFCASRRLTDWLPSVFCSRSMGCCCTSKCCLSSTFCADFCDGVGVFLASARIKIFLINNV